MARFACPVEVAIRDPACSGSAAVEGADVPHVQRAVRDAAERIVREVAALLDEEVLQARQRGVGPDRVKSMLPLPSSV